MHQKLTSSPYYVSSHQCCIQLHPQCNSRGSVNKPFKNFNTLSVYEKSLVPLLHVWLTLMTSQLHRQGHLPQSIDQDTEENDSLLQLQLTLGNDNRNKQVY